MARLRYNGLRTTLGASLTNSATSVTFAAGLTHSNGTNVPTITGSDYIPLSILDSSGHESEIVWLTAYTAAATTGTIARGKEGTSGVSHSSGDAVAGSAYAADLAFVGAKAYRSAAYNLVNNTLTAMPWDAEEYDSDGFHDNSTNNERFTVPTGFGGKYAIKANLGVSGSGISYTRFILLLRKNGTAIAGGRVESDFGTSSFPMMAVAMDVDLADGDYVDLAYLQISGNVRAMDTTDCAMSIAKLG